MLAEYGLYFYWTTLPTDLNTTGSKSITSETMVKKTSISLPDELFKKLTRSSTEAGRTRSSIIADALRAYLGEFGHPKEPKIYPTALWKLRERGFVRLRSPRLAKVRVRGDWIVESEM